MKVLHKQSLTTLVKAKLAEQSLLTMDSKKDLSKDNFLKIKLTKRESECFYFLAKGKSTKGIAKELGLSTRTIEGYIANLKNKMDVSYKSELMEKAIATIHQ